MIRAGIYKHWKGRRYDVLGLAIHRESGNQIVIYRKLYGEDRSMEYRPIAEFIEEISRPGYSGPRFRLEVSNQEGPK